MVPCFRPSSEILKGLVDRYTNGLVGRICGVSNTAVEKWLKAAGIKRNGKKNEPATCPNGKSPCCGEQAPEVSFQLETSGLGVASAAHDPVSFTVRDGTGG